MSSNTTSNSNTAAAEPSDILEERLIDAEYKIWKKNTYVKTELFKKKLSYIN